MGFFKRTIKDKTIKTIHFFKWLFFGGLGSADDVLQIVRNDVTSDRYFV